MYTKIISKLGLINKNVNEFFLHNMYNTLAKFVCYNFHYLYSTDKYRNFIMDLNDLNLQQKEAVLHTEAPLLILAGAGSGKTRVLTYRIAYIIDQKLAYPNEILAVTFTNKAADEMKQRVAKLVNSRQDPVASKQYAVNSKSRGYQFPFMGTFHSICVKILRKDGFHVQIGPNFTIYDENDQVDLVKQSMKELNISIKDYNSRIILNFISSAKNELIGPEQYKEYVNNQIQEVTAKVYTRYQKLLKDNNALDFDDLIMKTVLLLQNNNEVLTKYQNLFKYILVDEYQDTNHAQYMLIKLLAKRDQNICVVGDDDQAIYMFRGATIRNILSFEEDFPNAKVVKLEQNYRSTKRILDSAYEVIKHNASRKAKKLWTQNEEGQKIIIYNAEDELDEANFTVQKVEEIYFKSGNLEEIVVLYRTNAQSRVLEEALLKAGIPYKIIGSIRFYERKEIKDILAYLRVIYNTDDNMSLKRIINTPPRGIGAVTINNLKDRASKNSLSIIKFIQNIPNKKLKPELLKFKTLLDDLDKAADELNIVQLIKFILERTGYAKWLDDGSEENLARIENIKELITVASKYQDLEPQTGLAEFLNEVSLIEQQQIIDQRKRKDKTETVNLMTLHAAKGLEFEHVFIVGMEEGLFPHSRSYTDPTEMEEERRLAYVGITRAKKYLYLIHTQKRKIFGASQQNLPSRFLDNIPKELVEEIGSDEFYTFSPSQSPKSSEKPNPKLNLQIGDAVLHPHFGKGVILGVKEDIVRVSFEVKGVKELAVEFANLKKV